MKVFREDEAGTRYLIGHADVPDQDNSAYEVRLFGLASMITDSFALRLVTNDPGPGGLRSTERVVILLGDQYPDILPNWRPLAS